MCLFKNLLGISPSPSQGSRPNWRRLETQEVSHRGREIAGLGVWTATVTVSLQDGCGFADRESAAWTCQWCRSEVSSGEPGPPQPHCSGQRPTRARHLLPISFFSAQGGGRGLRPPPQAQFSLHGWTPRAKKAGIGSRDPCQGEKDYRGRFIVVRSLKIL